MSTAFMSCFTTLRYCSCGCPVGLFPQASSPYKRSLGMQMSGMWWMWPSQWSLRCLSSVNMLGRPVRDRTSVLRTLSCHDIPRMQQRLLMWKVLRRLSCLAQCCCYTLNSDENNVLLIKAQTPYFGFISEHMLFTLCNQIPAYIVVRELIIMHST